MNIQTKPIVVPGIDITLDLGFQFALLISAMLGYIHFLQKYWEKNQEKLRLSETFLDFSFWDIPRLKQPLLLIPIVIAFAIFIQVSIKSPWLITIFGGISLSIIIFIATRFYFYLSPNRKYVLLAEQWGKDVEWQEKWSRRIKKQLELKEAVLERDLYDAGMPEGESSRVEIILALHKYFERHEFDEDLVFLRANQLEYTHPLHKYDSYEWVLMPRKNLDVR
ncbi:MAG: hypothetical protein H6634_06245 [Anaerolineales bacterium]|nr:hypothetical protein [Anaerolineales bacterium]